LIELSPAPESELASLSSGDHSIITLSPSRQSDGRKPADPDPYLVPTSNPALGLASLAPAGPLTLVLPPLRPSKHPRARLVVSGQSRRSPGRIGSVDKILIAIEWKRGDEISLARAAGSSKAVEGAPVWRQRRDFIAQING